MLEDRELVERCLAGESSSVSKFVERFQQAVFGLCFRMLGHRQDAEDIAQETLIRAIRSLHTWDASRPIKPWIMTIAANRCRTAFEKRAKLPLPSDFSDFPIECFSAETQNDLGEELQLAIDQLKYEHRLCFVLFHQEQLSCEEIGSVLERPTGTVKTWLHRSRKQVAEILIRRGITPETSHELRRV